MEETLPTPRPVNGAGPSNGTQAGAFGGAVAVCIIVIFHLRGIDFPAGFEASLAVVISSGVAYVNDLIQLWVWYITKERRLHE